MEHLLVKLVQSPFQTITDEPFQPIIVPHTFIRKKPEAIMKWTEMSPEQQAELEKYKLTIVGDDAEATAFANFARLLREKRYRPLRIFTFNGVEFLFPDGSYSKQITGEYDQIIVVDVAKVVVYLEYKRTFSGNHARKKRQFEKFAQHLRNHFPVGEGWRLVTSYGFEKWPEQYEGSGMKRPCDNCRPFVFMIDDYEAMSGWFDNIISQSENANSCEDNNSTAFTDIVSTFLFLALVNRPKNSRFGQKLTQAEANEALLNTIQNVSGSAGNVLFWSSNQKLLLDRDEEEGKRLKFHSWYGTGK